MALVSANNHLAVDLHRLLSEEKTNVFFSPFSISTAMAMVLYAAEDETEAEMKKALGYLSSDISKDGMISAFREQISDLLESKLYTLTCANSLLMQKSFEVKQKYKTALVESFKAMLLEVDFHSEGSKAVSEVNAWVKEKTNKKIPELIKSLNPNAVMVLLNAVYFKGSWLRKFDKTLTCKQDFYNGGKKERAKPVDMMVIKESFKHVRKDTFQALQLPYEGEKLAMLILLPTAIDDLGTVEQEISSSFVHNLEEEMVKKKMILNLPRFSLQYSKSLISCFKRLGIDKLFKEGAELGGASDCKMLFCSKIVHNAVVDVNEEGSEAAAATLVEISIRSVARLPPKFIVDHPFLFAIYDIKSKIILFMGRVEEL